MGRPVLGSYSVHPDTRTPGHPKTVVDLPPIGQTVVDLPTSRRRVAVAHRPLGRHVRPIDGGHYEASSLRRTRVLNEWSGVLVAFVGEAARPASNAIFADAGRSSPIMDTNGRPSDCSCPRFTAPNPTVAPTREKTRRALAPGRTVRHLRPLLPRSSGHPTPLKPLVPRSCGHPTPLRPLVPRSCGFPRRQRALLPRSCGEPGLGTRTWQRRRPAPERCLAGATVRRTTDPSQEKPEGQLWNRQNGCPAGSR